jgi:hypothetical protein
MSWNAIAACRAKNDIPKLDVPDAPLPAISIFRVMSEHIQTRFGLAVAKSGVSALPRNARMPQASSCQGHFPSLQFNWTNGIEFAALSAKRKHVQTLVDISTVNISFLRDVLVESELFEVPEETGRTITMDILYQKACVRAHRVT